MTRPAVSSRLFALILAGGSFLASPGAPALADESAAPVAALPQGAARLNIAPLRLELDAGKTAATLMLTNTSERPVPVQTRLFAWSQENGEDRFAPSGALTISPAIVNIPPGATQIVRLLRNDAASPGEKRFRVAVDQLPDPAMAQSGQAEARLRFTIPVFLDRDKASPSQLEWRMGPDGLQAINKGGATAKILGVEARTAAGQALNLQRNSLRYVHGGSAITWPLAGGCGLGAVSVTAQVDGQAAHATASPACS